MAPQYANLTNCNFYKPSQTGPARFLEEIFARLVQSSTVYFLPFSIHTACRVHNTSPIKIVSFGVKVY